MPLFHRSYAADDLSESWRLACLKAMGLDGWEVLDRSGDISSSKFQVINLLPRDEPGDVFEDDSALMNDTLPWIHTAEQIQKNIQEMAGWIRQKQHSYVQLDMADEEASLIQSTVTSFAATTATEIESLHQCLSSSKTQKQQHCAGIVQILMTELKELVVEPFGRLSKQRNRAAVHLWQTPLQCRLWIPRRITSREKDPTLELLGFDDDGELSTDQRFLPTRPSHRLHRDFLHSYDTSRTVPSTLQRPSLFFRLDEPKFEIAQSVKPQPAAKKKPMSSVADDFNSVDGNEGVSAAALQQEAVLLQAKTQNDLDSVEKMEQTMVDITALLSQFANLVSQQQEDVWEIHDATASTKENLRKGQENLQDAKERTVASKHYMASGITAMGLLLLLFNWLRA